MDMKLYQKRRERFAAKVDFGVVADVDDIAYLTGVKISRGTLILQGDQHCLFVDSRYIDDLSGKEGLNVVPEEGYKEKIATHTFDTVTCDGSKLSHRKWLALSEQFPGKTLVDDDPLKLLRLKKDPEEIQLLKNAAQLTYQGYKWFKSVLKPGISEKQAATKLEFWLRDQGAHAMSFETIVAFGEGSAYPHYRAGKAELKEGMPVLLDFGIEKDGLVSDMTRSFFFWGEDPEYEKVMNLIQEVHLDTLAQVRAGVTTSFLDQYCYDLMCKAGYEQAVKHRLGHSLGQTVHEYPVFDRKGDTVELPEGSVVAIEPGLYFAKKWGIRHEDMVLVKSDGYEILTKEIL